MNYSCPFLQVCVQQSEAAKHKLIIQRVEGQPDIKTDKTKGTLVALKRRGRERIKTEREVVATKTKNEKTLLTTTTPPTPNTTHSNTIVAINSTVITQFKSLGRAEAEADAAEKI